MRLAIHCSARPVQNPECECCGPVPNGVGLEPGPYNTSTTIRVTVTRENDRYLIAAGPQGPSVVVYQG